MNIIKFDEDLKIAFNFNNVKTVYEITLVNNIILSRLPANYHI